MPVWCQYSGLFAPVVRPWEHSRDEYILVIFSCSIYFMTVWTPCDESTLYDGYIYDFQAGETAQWLHNFRMISALSPYGFASHSHYHHRVASVRTPRGLRMISCGDCTICIRSPRGRRTALPWYVAKSLYKKSHDARIQCKHIHHSYLRRLKNRRQINSTAPGANVTLALVYLPKNHIGW